MLDYTRVGVSQNGPSVTVHQRQSRVRLYKRRWIMLGLFVLCCASNIIQWLQYAIVANTIVAYYGVSYTAVDWSSMIFLLVYLIFIFPGCYVLDKFGLRFAIVVSMAGTCVGSWIKVASVSPDRYWVVILGQGIVGIFQIFMLTVPPKLAAVWFGPNEVSTACSIGIFGIQLGVALGFLLPPILIEGHMEVDIIEERLYIMTITIAIVTTVLFILVFTFFKDKPPKPPSPAQLQIEMKIAEFKNFKETLKTLFTNQSFVMLVLAGGINTGIFYAVSTLLNQIILKYYPDGAEDAGRIGLLIVFSGITGSITCGILLDAFKRFKATITIAYASCLLSMMAFTFTLHFGIEVVYTVAILLGFFMKALVPLGFQVAAELTYPIGEATSSGMISAAAQVFGIIFTYLYSYLYKNVDDRVANLTMCVVLFLGFVLLTCTRFDLQRQKVQECTIQSEEEDL